MKNKSSTKKLFIGSASALLVATAVAPVASAASFTDVDANSSHKQAIEALVDLNVISGYPDGSFKPSQTLTRSNVVKIMGKWLQSLGNTVPADYKTNLRFTDFTVNTDDELLQYGALVKDLGVFNGYQDGSLGASGTITRQNMAIVLIRAYDEINGTNLVDYVSNQTFTKDVIDLNEAKAEAKPFIDVLDFFDITNPIAPNFRPKETTTRAQFASLLYKTINIELPIEDITAIEGTTTIVNANTANQFLTVKANNTATTVADIVEAGYTVEFQSTSSNTIVNTATGELAANLATGSTFDYKVIVKKDGDIIESDLVTVKVLDFSSYIEDIAEYSLMQGTTTVDSGTISIADGNALIQATKATTIDGTAVVNPTAMYTSSNPSVASVNATTGQITPISTGSVNITIKVDGAQEVVALNVVADARVAQTLDTSLTNVKLYQGKSQVIDVMVKDQYGDLFEGTLTPTTTDAAIATVTASPIVNGAGTVTITSVAAGEATVDISNGTNVLKSINTKVSNDSVVTNRKIETTQTSNDFTLDVVKGSTDKTVNLHWNTYNAGDYLVGNETALTSTYNVSSSDTSVATVSTNASGVMTVTAVAPGTTTIMIKQGTVVRETKTITVVDTTPQITNITFEDVDPIETAGALSEVVLKSSGIKLSSDDYSTSISTNGTIYIDVDNDASFNAVNDIVLGNLNSTFSGDTTKIQNLAITGGSVTANNVMTGANGTIVVTVSKPNQVGAFAVKSITVQVP